MTTEPAVERCDDHYDQQGRQCVLNKYHEGEHVFAGRPSEMRMTATHAFDMRAALRNKAMHVTRNPHGWDDETRRSAHLLVCDWVEDLQRDVAKANEQYMAVRDALREIEAHHIEQNRRKGRPLDHSRTLSIVWRVLPCVVPPTGEKR